MVVELGGGGVLEVIEGRSEIKRKSDNCLMW